jgi:hypothetical protein
MPSGGTIEFSLTYDGAQALGPLKGKAGFGVGGFELKDFSFDIENPLNIGSQSSGAGAGKVTFDPFHITKVTDQATPSFFVQAGSDKPDGSLVPVFGFSTFDSAPLAAPSQAPLLSPWQVGDPCFQLALCSFSGVLVAYDAPMQVGSFDITFIPDTVPEPATLALLAVAFAGIGVAGRRSLN